MGVEDAPLLPPVADAPVTRQAETVGQPIGRPAWATADRSVRRLDRHCSWVSSFAQLGWFAATVLTAELTALLLYRVRPMVIVLILSRMTRIAPTAIVILATCRLYQPDTRSMWSSYQLSIEVRNLVMSLAALVASDCSDVVNGRPAGSVLRPS